MVQASATLFRIPMSGPDDVDGLARLIADGHLAPCDIVAIIGKTEGNGGVNDFTRAFATISFARLLGAHLGISPDEVEARVPLVMSGGTEGVLSPHATIFARHSVASAPGEGLGLVIGVAATRDFAPHEIGRCAQIEATAEAVIQAMNEAGISDSDHVHFVQVKCPLLTPVQIQAARRVGRPTVTEEAYHSMAYSRGASALGVALALGEVARPIADAAVLRDWSLFSNVASVSAGIELQNNLVVVLGNAERATSDCVIGHAVMRDAIDAEPVMRLMARLGVGPAGVAQILAKAEPSPDGLVRGWRHTMLSDTDLSSTRHARAAVGGLLSGLAGCPAIYVSGGAEHQGPPGGGPVALIARRP
jgi:cyanuric acid amidohydrolase